ncbi:MAG: hypothetical protein WC197_00545 [Candidatus Gastranaerophilaceae bacterium]|jgi:uncharacterized protein involved in exopolysaccharide biosynthesis
MFNAEKNTFIYLVKNERKFILTGLIVGLSLFLFYYIFFYVALYISTSKIYVKNIIKPDFVTNLDGGSTVVSESGYSNPLFNMYEILKSENIAYKIYPIIKEKFPEDLVILGVNSRESFFDSYVKLITSTTEPSTDVIKIKFMWPNKRHAPVVLDEILKIFKHENLIIKKTGETQRRQIIDKKTTEIAAQLTNVRSKIKNYKLKSNIADIETETINTVGIRTDLEKQASLLYSQIQYNKRKLNEFASELKLKNAEVALRATGIGNDPYLVKLSQELAVSKQIYAKMRAKFKDKYPEVISVRNEINELQGLINNRKKETAANFSIPRGIYDGPSSAVVTNFALTQAEMVSIQAQFGALKQGINQLKVKEQMLPKAQMGLDELEKLEDALMEAYKNIKEKQLEANIRENEIIDNIIILNNPSKASLFKMLVLTRFSGFMLLGSLLGLALAYIKQALEDKWIDIYEMRNFTGQNILSPIPWIKHFENTATQHILDASYTNLAYEITTKANFNKVSIITFISTSKAKPSSVITETLIKKLSEIGISTLLIDLVSKNTQDFDLVEAIKLIDKELEKNEQNTNNIPVSDFIHNILKNAIKKQSCTYENKTLQFDKIETNLKSKNLNNIITSKEFKYILSILKNHYEFIFINSPHGFISLPEIQNLTKLSESIVLIASKNTNRPELMKFVENIVNINTKILGIIPREENSNLEKNIKTLEQYKITENTPEQDTLGVN